MGDWRDRVKPLVLEGRIKVPYKWSVGATASRFFVALRDEGKFLATRCEACDKTYLPPRNVCPECFSELSEWKEVGPKGRIVTVAPVHYESGIHPLKPPFAYAVIRLDGCNTGLTHLVAGRDVDSLKAGDAVEPSFAPERKGSILDVEFFRKTD